MALDYEEMKKALEEFPNTPAGKKYFENIRKKHQIKLLRHQRFEEWLKHNDFETLMYRLILENGDEWREKCYHKGYEAHPNNKLNFLIGYIVDTLEPIKVPQLDCDFHNHIWFFKGYYFQMIWGQGVITNIFNGEDMRHVLSV